MFAAAAALTIGAVNVAKDEGVTNLTSETVEAAATNYIKMPKGYTRARIIKANNNGLNSSNKKALVKASMAGMKDNNFSDVDASETTELLLLLI